MRTTLTLDEDVAAKLKSEARKTGKSFRETVNQVMRAGLHSLNEKKPSRKFRIKTRKLHPREGYNLDNIGELLEQLEGPLHK